MPRSLHLLTLILLASGLLAGCDLNLDKTLIEDKPVPSDASVVDASPDVEAGKDVSSDADGGKLDSTIDAKNDAKPDGSSDAADAPVEADAPSDAACAPPPGSNACMQCAMANCCAEVEACTLDQQCLADLVAYLNCTSDAGSGCIMPLWQSFNSADMNLVQCLSPTCGFCNQT